MQKFIWAVALFLSSCSYKDVVRIPEEKVYIVIDSVEIEMVADEFGNQYMKQKGIYIPFPFETEEVVDSLSFLEAKNIKYVKRRF